MKFVLLKSINDCWVNAILLYIPLDFQQMTEEQVEVPGIALL